MSRTGKGIVKRAWGLALPLALVAAPAAADDVVISEFMAANALTLEDDDGEASDWIELYNDGSASVSLEGWSLTDDPLNPTKWVFPAVSIPPRGFLIVFASGKDRRNPALPLHASFKLASEGGHLALLEPGGGTAWEFAPYPPQVEDFSYGLGQNATILPLVTSGAPARASVPSNGSLGLTWTGVGFNPAGWTSGTTGVGYDRNVEYRSLLGTDLGTAMDGVNTSAYIRVPFEVEDPSGLGGLVLRMKYDDGFVAYVNGVEVASRNAPTTLSWDSRATGLHDDAVAVIFEEIPLSGVGGLLEAGSNVLAIHGLNDNTGSSDFLILPELDGTNPGVLDRDEQVYFSRPSPGGGNLPGFPGITEAPVFSISSQVFTSPLTLALTAESGASIRYTTNGSEPSASSTLYASPLSISASMMVRARAFKADLSPSPIISGTFIGLAADVRNFNSNLPIILIDNFGAGGVPQGTFQTAYMAIFDVGAGRSSLTRIPDIETRTGIKIRGSSTAGQPKPNLRLEARNEKDDDREIAPFGFPAEADWILHAPYGFDRALIRNPLMFELSNLCGRYAVRTRFCEVYLNTGGGLLSQADYMGVYSFMESIKRDEDRVDVERLTGEDNAEPRITGGYALKIDRLDPGDVGFSAAGQGLGYVYPKEVNVTQAQAAWIRGYINQFGTVLNGAGFADPTNGYARFIDADSWVDHHILNVLAKNVDALRLSTYLYKKRGGKIEYGPIWDFDRSINSTDGRDDSPNTWNGTGDGTDYFNYPWWGRLFQDPEFWMRWTDRWYELRRGPLGTPRMDAVTDIMAAQINEAQVRNFQRWSGQGGPGWVAEIALVKQWLATRASWIDSQFTAPPVLSSSSRLITPGFEVTISAPSGTIYYTLDGSDPRLRGGAISPVASVYGGPIVLDGNARVVARVRSGTTWGGKAAASFWTALPELVVTEVMYHPPPPLDGVEDQEDFEFIELMNAGASPIELGGMRLRGGIEFTFPDLTLDPEERVVVVKNVDVFSTRYDASGILIAGEHSGNLSNRGEEIEVLGPLDEPVQRFTFVDDWHPLTDGQGESLTILDPHGSPGAWSDADGWSPSSVIGGTPGEPDDISGLGGRQRPGDSNQDGLVDISDGVSLLRRLFGAAPPPLPCEGGSITDGGNLILLDVNGDALVNVTDVIHLLAYIFREGPGPALGSSCLRIEGCPSACGL
jgi:hypothetical protein